MALDPKAIPTVVNRFGTTTLAANLNQNTTTSCTLSDASGLPDGTTGGCIQIADEIIYFESRVGNVLSTLRRGQDGTTAVAHAAGVVVTSRIVAGNFNSLKSAALSLDATKYQLPAGGTVDQFIDGTGALQDIPAYQDSDTVIIPVRNATGATIPKASVVYVSGESGGKLLIALADADSEVQSAKTIGLTRNEILNNSDGFVVLIGAIEGVNTIGMTAGAELWLSQTPGAYTTTKPISPAHLVQVGFVKIVGSSTTNGSLEVRVDNGYEIEELHDVLVTSIQNGQVLKWDSVASLWKNVTLQISDTSGLQTALDGKVDENAPITGATKTKITYDSKGLVTAGADATTDDIAEGAINKYYPAADAAKLAGIEPGAEVNNISDIDATDLTDGGDSTLHFHSSDRDRSNHTGTQTAATISDFDTEVANNTAVAANTAKVSADGSINTHSDVDTSTTAPTSGQALVWNGTTWVPDDVVVDPAGANTEIQFNNSGVFGASANLTYDGALNVKGVGATSATQTLRLTNSSAVNLLTMNDNGTFNGRYIAIGNGTRLGILAAQNATGSNFTAIGGAAALANTTGTNWTAIGSSAGLNSLTNSNWTAIGTSAGRSNSSGNSWTAVGKEAGNGNSSGSDWTAIGTAAGFSNTNGFSWVAIGRNAGLLNTTGSSWTAIGTSAGQSNTSGSDWIAIGQSSGSQNTSGTNWISIGTNAAINNTTGSFFTAIGRQAGYSNTTGSNWTALGFSSGFSNLTGSSWVAIGHDAGSYIKGTTTDLQYFQNSTYIGSKTKGTNGTDVALTDNETVIGYAAEGNGSNTVTIGSSAVTANYFRGRIETTSSGTTSATQALKLSNSSSTNLFTMNDDGSVTGNYIAINEYPSSLRIGAAAAASATGSNWLAFGGLAAQNNTTGGGWTAIGRTAGNRNISGDNWTAIGISSGLNNLEGSGWIAIGYRAGRYVAPGTSPLEYFENSIYLGIDTKGTNGTQAAPTTNETVIGSFAQGNGSNTVTIGSSAVTDNYLTGDIHALGAGKGIIVTSPDGLTTLRIGIDNSGNIVTSTP